LQPPARLVGFLAVIIENWLLSRVQTISLPSPLFSVMELRY